MDTKTRTPTITPELIDTVVGELAAGGTMRAIARVLGVNDRSLAKAISKDPVVMRRLHEARVMGTDFIMEDVREFGDPESEMAQKMDPHRARIALDALKFYVSKMNPEKYGDKVDLNVRGRLDMGAILLAADKRLAALPSRAPLRLPDVTTVDGEDE